MGFVALNLDLDDVETLHAAVEGALDACACSAGGGRERCARCASLGAIAGELDRLSRNAEQPARNGRSPVLLMPPVGTAFRRTHRRSSPRGARRLAFTPPLADL